MFCELFASGMKKNFSVFGIEKSIWFGEDKKYKAFIQQFYEYDSQFTYMYLSMIVPDLEYEVFFYINL